MASSGQNPGRDAAEYPTVHGTALPHKPSTKIVQPLMSTVLGNHFKGWVLHELEIFKLTQKGDVFQEGRFCCVKGERVYEDVRPQDPKGASTLQRARMLQVWLSVTQSQDNLPAGPRRTDRQPGCQTRVGICLEAAWWEARGDLWKLRPAAWPGRHESGC